MLNMRVRLFTLAAGLAVLAAASPLISAQAGIVVKVPFEFRVGDQQLPAGQYTVVHLADPSLLRISDGAGHVSVTISISASKRATPNPVVTFNRYGDVYFLYEVRWADSTISNQMMKSKLETQIARDVAPERVVATTKR
jgi:hypothetical protein